MRRSTGSTPTASCRHGRRAADARDRDRAPLLTSLPALMRRTFVAILLVLTCVVVAPRGADAAPVDRVDATGAAVDAGSPEVADGYRPVGIARGPGGGYWVAT